MGCEAVMLKILLVDDEKQEREGIRFLINKFGFPLEIAEVANGKLALEYIMGHAVDILFTDVKMPYMDGLELAKAVNEHDKNVVIIIFSAYGEFEYAKKACAANAVNYLLKPIEVEEFETVMKEVIELCTQRQQWEQEKISLQKADKKLLLYQMVNSRESVGEILERLKQYGIVLDNKYMFFLSVETGSTYFESSEERFNDILTDCIHMNYEYINLYPNHAYILVYGSGRPDGHEMERIAKKIYQEMTMEQKGTVSVIVGECFQGTDKLSEKIEKIENLKEETFSYFSGIQYTANISIEKQSRLEEAARIKDCIFRSIEDKNLPAVRKQLEDYIKRLEEEKASSAFYTKYTVLDIVKALYSKFSVYNLSVVYETSDEIMKCSSLMEMQVILKRILSEIETANENLVEDGSSTVREIQSIINNEYMNDLSLNELAERVFLTPAYISYIFKQETGQNLIKYLTDFRMNKAKELLEQGQMKIVDIGRACGYLNQPYFNRLFKNNFGVTPKQFRENMHVK